MIHQPQAKLQKLINNIYIYIYIQRERERERERERIITSVKKIENKMRRSVKKKKIYSYKSNTK